MDIKEVKAIVTGGSSGIGEEVARQLQSQGAQVVICGRHESIEEKAAELNVFGIQADMSDEADVKRLFGFAVERMGGLNVLVNNAGIGFASPLVDTSTENFTRIWETNVKGVFMAGRAAAKHFIGQRSGNIINIGSTAASKGYANGSAYASSKFAVSALTECWRAELRPYNIRVMQVNPSEVVTDFGPKFGWEHSNADRKLHPTEIAHVIVNMLSMSDVGFVPEVSVWATNPGLS